MKNVTACLSLCLYLAAAPLWSQAKHSKETMARIKSVENNLLPWVQTQEEVRWNLEERMKAYKVKGLSIAVIKDYKIDWVKGYGFADAAENRKVDEKTLFQAASISKSLNAVGMLKLAQDKKLDLYSDINTYLKSWKFPYDSVSKGKKITIANLLSHTAGLSVHGFGGYAGTEALPSVTDILDGKKPANSGAVRSEFGPGLKFQYSGGGTTISQLIAMDITGKRYADYIWETVLKPLGMTGSSYEQPPLAAKKNLLATAYNNYGIEIPGKYHVYPEQGAAGLWTNPTDLSKYIIEMQLAYAGKSQKVLNRDMVKLMTTPYEMSPGGLGVFIANKGNISYFQHGGANQGFRCHYFGSLEGGNGVVVMVNSDNGDIISEIISSVATTYNWKDFYTPVKKTVVKVPEAILNEYIGEYSHPDLSFSILKKDRSLWVKQGDLLWKMYFTSDTEFFMYEDHNTPRFTRNADGKVDGVKINDGFSVPKVSR
jgi:CubicO group peptidase (beta-lactamase class C family)